MNNPTVLLIGGPETGKSNFLFRTWTHIDSNNGLVAKNGLPLNAEYLRTGAECQLRCMFAGRTSQEVQLISTIPIQLRSNFHKKALLIVPDINGEQINQIYHARKWTYEWESLITESTAYLFFIRVGSPQTIAPLDWITWHGLYCDKYKSTPVVSRQDNTIGQITENAVAPPKPPTQVILVDWLQFILKAVHDKQARVVRPRVGIVVTAWDCVPPDFSGGPSLWIQENMPLLHQFCVTNQDVFEFSFFGTSIFSGDPVNDSDFAEEIVNKDPRTMGYVQYSSDNHKSDDFTIPIAWALGWQDVM